MPWLDAFMKWKLMVNFHFPLIVISTSHMARFVSLVFLVSCLDFVVIALLICVITTPELVFPFHRSVRVVRAWIRAWVRLVKGVRRRSGSILEVMGRDFRLFSVGHDPMTALAFKLAI